MVLHLSQALLGAVFPEPRGGLGRGRRFECRRALQARGSARSGGPRGHRRHRTRLQQLRRTDAHRRWARRDVVRGAHWPGAVAGTSAAGSLGVPPRGLSAAPSRLIDRGGLGPNRPSLPAQSGCAGAAGFRPRVGRVVRPEARGMVRSNGCGDRVGTGAVGSQLRATAGRVELWRAALLAVVRWVRG